MSIEIRQLSVRCRVVASPPPARPAPAVDPQLLKEQVLAQCRAWLRDELRRTRER